jgi:pyrroline-5-carboxylate reductase
MAYELGIIGAGNMAEAIVRGVLRAGTCRPEQIIASDVSAARREAFASIGVTAVERNEDVARQSRVVVLSVKPQQMQSVLEGLGPVLDPSALVISIAAGKSAAFIERHLGGGRNWRVIRTMPNTPMLVGLGVVGIAKGTHATDADVAVARRIFESAAEVVEVREDQIDAVTAISGSGPAYVYFLVEQMVQAGVEMGLTGEQATAMAAQTALGAAKMLTESTDSPAELRRKVTSPGGTTQAAIETMQARGVPEAIVAALHRAQQRGRELAG